MNRKSLTIFLFLLCAFNIAFSQQIKISGHVKGIDGFPITSATLQLKNLELLKVISYDFTDSLGFYNLVLIAKPDQQLLLIVSSLGFLRDTIKVSTSPGAILKYDFILKEDVNQLKEITIEAPPRAIEVVNDTTKYKVSSFTDPSDRNLQDVIKKMPGMEVSRDGTIYFKKRPVSRVLLENDDMAGSNYKAITQNVKPELVDEIQAIEHWVEDDLLRGIINSDEIVLNLTLNDKRKQKIIGSADLGYGTKERSTLSANFISYFNKTKAFGLVKNNNTGASQADMFNLSGANRNLLGDGKIISHQIYSNLPFDDNPLVLNNTLSASFNTITRFSPAFKMGASVYGNRNKLSNESVTTSIYQEPIKTTIIDEQQQQSNNKHYQTDLTGDYLTSKNSRLSTRFSFKARPQEYNSLNLSSFNMVNSDEIIQSQHDKLANYHLGFKYTIKANVSSALIINANFAKDVIDQRYNAKSELYAAIPLFTGTNNLEQLVKTNFQIAKFDIQALKKRNFNYFYLNIGAELNDVQVYTDLLNKISGTALPTFLNDYSFKNDRLYAVGKYAYDNRKISFTTLLKASLMKQKQFATDSTFLLLEPELNLRTTITRFQNISLGYNYKNILANPLEYYAQPVLTDLRTINIGLNRLYNFGAHNVNVMYNNTEFNDNYFSFTLNASAQLNDGGFIGGNFFKDEIYYSEKIIYKGNKNLSAGLGLKKLIPVVQSKFSVDYNTSLNDFYGKVEDEINNYSSTSHFINTTVATGFKLPVNFTLEFQAQTGVTRKENVKFNKQISYKYAFQSRYQVMRAVFNLIDFSWYRIGTKDYRLLNAELQIKPAKGVFSYSIYGKNLGNFKSINNFAISNVGETRSSTSVLGRYVLGSVSLSIK